MEASSAREIYERNKERGLTPKARVFSLREWLLAFFTFVGLLLTAITTYFATIRTIDEVRVVVNDPPSMLWDSTEFRFQSQLGLTLVNSGNRSAAITSIFFDIYQDTSSCTSTTVTTVRLKLDSEPIWATLKTL